YGEIVHCQGRAIFSREPAPARLDLTQLEGRMIRLPTSVVDKSGDYVLHPTLMDGALHAALVSVSLESRLPFSLETLRIVWPCSPEMFAWVRYSPGSEAADAVVKLDVDLCNERGEIAVQMRGVSWQR